MSCSFDAQCRAAHHICVEGTCVPRCDDSDGGVAITTPGKTTAYHATYSGDGALLWNKITMVDGCKGSSLLLEYTCSPEGKNGQPGPSLDYQYVACPTGQSCEGVTDPTTGTYAAACVSPANSIDNCDGQLTWMSLGPINNTIDVRTFAEVNGHLCTGGLGGVRCLAPGSAMWQDQNTGFPVPKWLDQTLVSGMAVFENTFYAVMINAPVTAVFRFDASSNAWLPQDDTKPTTQNILASALSLYASGSEGAEIFQPASDTWVPMGVNELMITSLYHDGSTLFAGTDYGDVWWFDVMANSWWPALEVTEAAVTTMQYYDTYFYAGNAAGLYRCWSEAPLWGIATYCEQIEPETGLSTNVLPEALHVHSGQLYLGTSEGIYRFDAANDHWNPMNTGLMNPTTLVPLPVRRFTTYHDHLIAGTSHGVYQLVCKNGD